MSSRLPASVTAQRKRSCGGSFEMLASVPYSVTPCIALTSSTNSLGLSSQSRSKFPFTLTYLFLAVVEFSCIVSAGTRSSGSASLEGSVMDSRTGEPVRKVIVELISEDSEEVKVFTSTTSPEGRFSFDTLLPGRYRVFAERTGFIEVNQKGRETGQVAISLATGQQLKGLSLYMLPAAVVTGHVVDEDG